MIQMREGKSANRCSGGGGGAGNGPAFTSDTRSHQKSSSSKAESCSSWTPFRMRSTTFSSTWQAMFLLTCALLAVLEIGKYSSRELTSSNSGKYLNNIISE